LNAFVLLANSQRSFRWYPTCLSRSRHKWSCRE